MARLRVRFRFNPGRLGAPMDKLGEFSVQAERFLRALAQDIGATASKGQWLALNFNNSSVQFDSEYASALADALAHRGNTALRLITSDDPLAAVNQNVVSYATIAEYSRISKALDPDEKFVIGLFDDDQTDAVEWRDVPFKKVDQIRQLLDASVVTHGSVQGVVHAWFVGSKPAFFNLRELSTSQLVKCEYPPDQKVSIAKAAQNNNVVIVYGEMKWDRTTNTVVTMQVSDIESTRSLTDAEFESIFGSMPEYTGSMSTGEYIDWLRGDGE